MKNFLAFLIIFIFLGGCSSKEENKDLAKSSSAIVSDDAIYVETLSKMKQEVSNLGEEYKLNDQDIRNLEFTKSLSEEQLQVLKSF